MDTEFEFEMTSDGIITFPRFNTTVCTAEGAQIYVAEWDTDQGGSNGYSGLDADGYWFMNIYRYKTEDNKLSLWAYGYDLFVPAE